MQDKVDIPNNEKVFSTAVDSDFTSECKTKAVNTMNHYGITLKEKSSDPPINEKKQDSAAEPASTSPKRRKVVILSPEKDTADIESFIFIFYVIILLTCL
jgi:DNA polymerase delta subunit 3